MKGQIQTLEAIITVGIIAGVFIAFYSSRIQLPESESVNWKLSGFNALKIIDQSNRLRDYVVNNNTTAIVSELEKLIPPTLNFNITICEENCPEPKIESSKLVSVVYLIAGDIGNFTKRQVVLYIWE